MSSKSHVFMLSNISLLDSIVFRLCKAGLCRAFPCDNFTYARIPNCRRCCVTRCIILWVCCQRFPFPHIICMILRTFCMAQLALMWHNNRNSLSLTLQGAILELRYSTFPQLRTPPAAQTRSHCEIFIIQNCLEATGYFCNGTWTSSRKLVSCLLKKKKEMQRVVY